MDTVFLDSFSREVWETTYKHHTDTTIDDTLRRVAEALASVEKTVPKQKEWAARFYELLSGFKATAGGRILANAGTGWGGTSLMNCLHGETEVLVTNDFCGETPTIFSRHKVKDLIGKDVRVLTRDRKWEWTRFFSYGAQPLCEIKFSNGDVCYATKNHRWLVKTRQKNKLEEVTTSTLEGKQIPYVFPRASIIVDGLKFRTGIQHGLVMGDGNIYLNGRFSILNQFGDSCHLVEDYFDTYTEATYRNPKVRKVTVNRLPLEFKTQIPSISVYGEDYVKGFIAGLVASDGCVDKYGSVMLFQSDEDFLRAIRDLAAEVGIVTTSIKMYREKNPFNGKVSPSFKLSFLKASFPEEMIIKNNHKEYRKNCRSKLDLSVKVVSVKQTDRVEEVFCCRERQTGTFVLGNFLLTGNCFVGPKPSYDQDSMEGIFAVLQSQVLTLKSEGGWGMNFSFIRPRGAFIYGIGVETPGAVKYMELFNTSSDVVTAGAGKKKAKKENEGKTKIRKGAMMAVLDCWHPDIEEYIKAKLQEGRLNKFNLSVNCANVFMNKVVRVAQIRKLLQDCSEEERQKLNAELEETNKWELCFPDTKDPHYKEEWDGNFWLWKSKGYTYKVYKVISVEYLWGLIMDSTYNRNDPGVLFLDRANETHCYAYGGPKTHIASTNPCGEQCLPFGFVCNLGSINLTQFVMDDGTFDFYTLQTYVPWLVRLLDNVNDLANAPLPEYEASIREARRIGLGVMGWGSTLYMMRLRFASDEAEALKERIMKALTESAVQASIALAKEKGPFLGCDANKHAEAPFWKQIGLSDDLLKQIRKHGMRNSALFSCQPTGNTGVLANVVSGGIEPIFMPEYIRTVIVDGCPEEMLDITPKYWEGEFKETEVFKWTLEGADKILKGVFNGVVYKIDKNRGLTKEVACVDYGVRWLRQRNLWDAKAPWAVTASSLSVEEHLRDLRGFARWVDSSISKTVNLANDYPYDKFNNLYLDAYTSGFMKGLTTYRAGTMMNVLATNKFLVPKTIAPKRPDVVNGELHHFVHDGKKYYVAVGLDDEGSPYEVFTGVNQADGEVFIPKVVKKGTIKKVKRGNYVFIRESGAEYELTNGHSHDTADALTRAISGGLRHGESIDFIVHQLEKTEGPMVCFSKILARTLKKYIKDGTKVSGEECPDCKSTLVRQEGCLICPQCGFSKCS